MSETLYVGTAVGGPMNGKVVEGRYPGGILFVSKATNTAWLYDFFADQEKFYVRPVGFDGLWDQMSYEQKLEVYQETVAAGMNPARELDYEMRMRAADSANTEVRALPDEEGDD